MPTFLPEQALQDAVLKILDEMKTKQLELLLNELQLLPQIVKNCLTQLILDTVSFESDELQVVNKQLTLNLPVDGIDLGSQPTQLIQQASDQAKPVMIARYRELLLRKYIQTTYNDFVDPYFLERRAGLERVVYGVIRVSSPGVADELYLRILDGDAVFADLAQHYSQGDERFTKGLVGPVPLLQVHPTIQTILARLSIDEVHAPVQIDNWFLIIMLIHTQPARMTDDMRTLLMRELFEKDLKQKTDSCIESLLSLC